MKFCLTLNSYQNIFYSATADSIVTELNLTFLHFFFILAIYYNVMGDPNLTESGSEADCEYPL